MNLQEQYDSMKRELNRITQGTEEFMIKLCELKHLEDLLYEKNNNRENNSTLSE